jgi:hypothetical protein
MGYDFSTLSSADFEDLVLDLIGRELGIRFEAFGAGPDGGIDGRHALGAQSTVLQAKHYAGSTFSALKSTMRRERASIDLLGSARYLLTTSRPISPDNKSKLAEIIGPALQCESDIFGPDDLNGLLRKYPDIEKSHIKLWLAGAAVLERVVRSAAHNFTRISKDEITTKVRVYAHNPSFKESRDKLEENHVLIISGPPGVGKTTLGEMLSFAYIDEGWEFIVIRSLDDGFAEIVDTNKQIFFFDDFLGKIALDARALASKDSDLARFIKRIRTSPNARFILTTRAYIFEEARRSSEQLADKRLDVSKYVLDVGIYTRRIRARILYNHLLVSGTPKAHIRALIESGKIPNIVDHKNYNPRVIEWMTDVVHIGGVTSKEYADAFLSALANPYELWDTAFRKHIPEKCRHLLFALFFCSEYGAEIEDLRTAYSTLHPFLCRKYGYPHDPKDFEEAIRILEGGFINLRGHQASFINPSIRDYLAEYLADVDMLCEFATTAKKADWAKAVWHHKNNATIPLDSVKVLATSFENIAKDFTRLPTWRRTPNDPTAYSFCDLSNTGRISLLIEWWEVTEAEHYAALAVAVAKHPANGFDSWRDGEALVELARKLREREYFDEFPFTNELIAIVENALIAMLQIGMPVDELDNIYSAIEAAGDVIGQEVIEAANEAVVREIDDVTDVVRGIDSESTLEDHIKTIQKLAPRADVSNTNLARAISIVRERIAEIEEQTSEATPPSFSRLPRTEPDQFDDVALINLFAPLALDETGESRWDV